MSWSEYQEKTYKTKPQYLAVYLHNHLNVKTIVDLGCGSGNETVYFLRKGYKVTSIDAYLNEDYILNRINEEQKKKLTLIKAKMEDVRIPSCDVIFALFTLPFCSYDSFKILWKRIYDALPKDGYLVANLFGERCYHKDSGIKVYTKNEVELLLIDYEIIKWKEQEYTREDNTHWHYYDFVAQKK